MGWQGRRVLITGISGFVGAYLAEHLVDMGATVSGLVRRRADGDIPRNIRFHRLEERVNLLSGDLLDPTSISDALDESQPQVVFHLAAQSFVPRSFQYPGETYVTNVTGTLNLLEAIRLRRLSPTFVFAGSSEEYGLVYTSEQQYQAFARNHGSVFPEPVSIPEVPINEGNPLRPMSPYAVTKVQGDLMVRNYAMCWDLPAVVSRAFNHEGAGRGRLLVTSIIASQVAKLSKCGHERKIVIGNVNSFRDWSHVNDVVRGYCLLAEKGRPAEIYNQGSQRTTSVLSYILLALKEVGMRVERIESFKNAKKVIDPLQSGKQPLWGRALEMTKVDSLMLGEGLGFELEDEGIWVHTDSGKIPVQFNPERFRALDVPILLADNSKISQLGFKSKHTLSDVVRDQVNYYLAGNSG